MASSGSGPSDRALDSAYSVVVAIDFGTTYSGYAVSFKKNPDDIFVQNTWGDVMGIPGASKTPSCVLTDKKINCIAVGHKAIKKYINMDSDEAKQHRFYSLFKMTLHTKKTLNKTTMVEDICGNKAPAIDILAMVLAEMKAEMLVALSKQGARDFDVNLIRWVITVPTIWTDVAKRFMQEAAVKADLVDHVDSKKLILSLEPEAASICCQTLPSVKNALKNDSSFVLPVGTKYLVLDAGGGTLDITAHEVLPETQVKELYRSNGGDLGASQVDRLFLELLDEIFDAKFVKLHKTKNPSDCFTNLINRFETVKKSLKSSDGSATTAFRITANIVDLFHTEFKKKLLECVSKKSIERKIVVKNGMIKIPNAVLLAVFQPVVNDIVSYLEDLLKKTKLEGITTILMVGGFSNCDVLQEAIKTKFSDKYSVVIPKEADQVVMKGAVQFGHKPRQRCVFESPAKRPRPDDGERPEGDTTKKMRGPNKTDLWWANCQKRGAI
uniref:Heat shock protein family A member 12 variant X5 n=1 Tax=Urechis unicinctus TaxID=6432 RepID=A0AAU0MWD5_UREUN